VYSLVKGTGLGVCLEQEWGGGDVLRLHSRALKVSRSYVFDSYGASSRNYKGWI
jgi:hypothetical protein